MKEYNLRKLIFSINKMKEENNTNQEQSGKSGENIGHGEIVYKI